MNQGDREVGVEQPYLVRICVHGAKPFTWRNVFAESPIEAAHLAFRENYWPEAHDVDAPLRITVTVTEVKP